MKANEMPERIWLGKYTQSLMLSDPNSNTYMEYIRTDAFIEKALAYLHDKFYFNNVFYGVVSTDFNAMEELFEDFEEYLKK